MPRWEELCPVLLVRLYVHVHVVKLCSSIVGVHKRSMSSSESFEFLEPSSGGGSSSEQEHSDSQESDVSVHKKSRSDTTDTVAWEMLMQQGSTSGSEEVDFILL